MKRLALLSVLCVGCAETPAEVPRSGPPRYQQIRTVARNGNDYIIEVDYGGETHAFLLSERFGRPALAKIGTYPLKTPAAPKP